MRFEQATEIKERRELARFVKMDFPKDLPGNWKDSHKPMDPFGTLWGRGVVFDNKGEYFVKIGSYSTSHASIKSGIPLNVLKTFYFGFANNTIYIAPASVNNVDFNRDMKIEILATISEQGPLRGISYRFS